MFASNDVSGISPAVFGSTHLRPEEEAAEEANEQKQRQVLHEDGPFEAMLVECFGEADSEGDPNDG